MSGKSKLETGACSILRSSQRAWSSNPRILPMDAAPPEEGAIKMKKILMERDCLDGSPGFPLSKQTFERIPGIGTWQKAELSILEGHAKKDFLPCQIHATRQILSSTPQS